MTSGDGPSERRVLSVRLRRAAATRLLFGLGLANVAILAVTALRSHLAGYHPFPHPVLFVLRQMNIQSEATLGAFYSSGLFLLTAVAALLCSVAVGAPSRSVRSRRRRVGWALASVLFAGLSLDEVGVLHERIGIVDGLNPFDRLDGWVGVFALPGLVGGILLAVLLYRDLRRTRAALLLATVGTILICSVFFQEQIEANMRRATGGPRPMMFAVLEEGSELFGALALLSALLIHLFAIGPVQRSRNGTTLRLDISASRRAVWSTTAGGLVLLGGSAAVLALGAPNLPSAASPDLAALLDFLPVGWCLAVVALWSAGAALYLALSGSPPRSRVSTSPDLHRGLRYGAVAVFALFVAVDLGSGLSFTERMWDGSPRMRLVLDGALTASAVLPALLLWGEVRRRWRLVLLTSCLTLSTAFWVGFQETPVLVFIGLGLLLSVLTGLVLDASPPARSSGGVGRSARSSGG